MPVPGDHAVTPMAGTCAGGSWPLSAASPAWLRRGSRRAARLAARAEGGSPKTDSADALSAPPPQHNLTSHPLPAGEVSGPQSGAETRGEDDFDTDVGLSVETADEGSSAGLSVSTQARHALPCLSNPVSLQQLSQLHQTQRLHTGTPCQLILPPY